VVVIKNEEIDMSKCKSEKISEFSMEGRFLGFEFEDGYKLKYLRLATPEGECCIKLCKELRTSFELRLTPGNWVQVVGEKKLNLKNGLLKLKAERVIPENPNHQETSVSAKAKPAKTKASILVCQKSSCMKRGGKAVCQALEAALCDRGLEDQVAIKGTGCLKECSSGPNVVVMPDKSRYSRIQAAEIPSLLDKHFPAQSLDEKQLTERDPQRELTTSRSENADIKTRVSII